MKSKLFSSNALFCICLFLSVFLTFSHIHADTLILKNGRKIKAERVWEENGVVKYSLYGSVVGHPKADVLEIVHDAVAEDQDRRIDSFFYPWKLGQTINEVVSLCQRYDYPLHRDGLISVNRHFNPKMCMPYTDSHSKFNYKATAYGYSSVVLLEFNPDTKRLVSVETRIRKPNNVKSDDFMAGIGRKLARDYGEPDSRAQNWNWFSNSNAVSLANGNSAAIVKLTISLVAQQADRSTQTASSQSTDVNSHRSSVPQKRALPSVKPAVRTPIVPSVGFMNRVLKVLSQIFIGTLVVVAIIVYLKWVSQKKTLGSLNQGFKKKKTYVRYEKNFSSGRSSVTNSDYGYEKANGLFTAAEKVFMSVLADVIGGRYQIQGKVRLADLISPESTLDSNQSKWAFRKISQKHVDFVICDKSDFTILGVVELDDKSHLRPDRMARDKFVDAALSGAGLAILHYPVKSSYEPADIREKLVTTLGLDLDDEDDGGRFRDSRRAGGATAESEDDLRWAPPGFKS
ncbi:DUF2726 domain-containing protein [uncultured Desulfosarcina sp.]|uniref:DUF2726 domain-containing protein n=1 Tax=uncultured Desulfosarcina sp. TaxID=218289 RepID=UPI0029C84D46|nr:DUF2726 domain-containing protein [uncultured Desulfosarcina sp.]